MPAALIYEIKPSLSKVRANVVELPPIQPLTGPKGTGAANWTYDYDPSDRITSRAGGTITRGWTYDSNTL
jgi:hypothetical protein